MESFEKASANESVMELAYQAENVLMTLLKSNSCMVSGKCMACQVHDYKEYSGKSEQMST